MNVGIFNRVNSKIKEGDGMYSEWNSLPLEGGGQGVLGAVGGREVVLAVVRQLASHQPSPLTTDEEVEWVLEVIRFGLSLPLSEHEALRDCVRVCCSWLSALLPTPGAPAQPPPPAVPPPLAAQPHRYANKILNHLHNLFVPRPNESGNLISKQAVLCHRVLRLARSLADSAALGPREWRSLLLLLLAAAAALLAPPAPLYGAAEQLCERVLCVLFEVWILACHRCFPSPSLWRTLREQCVRWRHRAPLTEQWARVSLCLTARLLTHMYGPMYPAVPISEEDSQLVPGDMSAEAVTQTWYRVLHTIGNPVDLTRPALISHTPDFLQYWMTAEEGQGREGEGRDAWVGSLAHIFHRAMMGVAAHVDAFLGRSTERWVVESVGGAGALGAAGGPAGGGAGAGGGPPLHDEGDLTPPAHRRLAKSFSSSRPREKVPDKSTPRSSLIGLTSGRPSSVVPTTPPNSITSQVSECEKPPPTPLRPQVNSILHLFGDWLLDAALVGGNTQTHERVEGTPPPPSLSEATQKINMINYQAGRCVALGALCRVLCSKQGREAVLAPYLARAYSALQRALRDPRAAAAVVLHAADIFRVDLDGVLVLVPDFINALERILTEREPKLDCGHVDRRDLRKAAISILLSLVGFPYHYRGLPVPEFPGYNEYAGMTLGEFSRGRLSVVAACAVQTEPEEALAVPLLSALYLCVRHNACSTDRRARSESGGPSDASDDFAADVRDLDPSSPNFGSSLVVRATYLVCHRLISSWKGDLQVSLAALELLSGLAKLHASKPEATERSRAVRWMCDYIVAQCGRPPPGHSRDVHSCVVGAYGALSAWLCAPLLADGDCLAALLEVVELGISGCRSRGGAPAVKDDKELKPVSMRVRDAAEALLMLILEQVGEGTSEGRWCRLDERWLQALGHAPLRHFSLDGHILLSLLEEPLANSQEPQPTVVVIIRSSWGRWSWSLCSRGAPRCATLGSSSCPRPVAMLEPPARPPAACRALPAAPPCALDSSFPSLEAVLRRLSDPGAATLFKLLEQQTAIEKKVRDSEDKALPEEYVPPEPVTEFQTARLFLAHFGLLNIGGEKKGAPSRLVSLSGGEALQAALRRLDATGARAALTAHVFYARRGQTRAEHIVGNSTRLDGLSPAFIRMLKGLGSPVFVSTHAGWSGHVRTSYDAAAPPSTHAHTHTTTEQQNFTPSLYDGREQVLYWADATDEIAFVVPSGRADDEHVDGPCLSTNRSDTTDKSGGSWWDVSGGVSGGGAGGVAYERSVSESERGEKRALDKARALSLELDKPQQTLPGHVNTGTGSGRRNRDFAPKILIIWLEDYEDHLNMPIDDLISYCETGVPCRRLDTAVLCVSAVRSGLVRVGVSGGAGAGAGGAAGVLADGALVAPRLLPDCLRRAACFLARRARLNTDLYQPPPVRRRHLIQEISQQFKRDLTEPELLESLFRAP